MISDIALAIVIIFVPGMIHVMLPDVMARLYEKSFRARMKTQDLDQGRTLLRPGFIRLFGFIWIAFGIWIIVDTVFLRDR